MLPEDYCKKGPCNFNTVMFVSKVGNPCPTLGARSTSRQPVFWYALLVGEKQHENRQGKTLYTEALKTWSTLGHSSPTPHPMGSCSGLPCNSPLATPKACGMGHSKYQINTRCPCGPLVSTTDRCFGLLLPAKLAWENHSIFLLVFA